MMLEIAPHSLTYNHYSHPDAARPPMANDSKPYPQANRAGANHLGHARESQATFRVVLS